MEVDIMSRLGRSSCEGLLGSGLIVENIVPNGWKSKVATQGDWGGDLWRAQGYVRLPG